MLRDERLENQLEATAVDLHKSTLGVSKTLLFLVLTAGLMVGFWKPLRDLVSLSVYNEEYSHLVLIPAMIVCLLYWERRKIFLNPNYSVGAGELALLAAIIVSGVAIGYLAHLRAKSHLFLAILSLVVLWAGGFLLCYGVQAFRAAGFPLRFGLLMVPLPRLMMDNPIEIIQRGSADVADLLFNLAGIPVFRDGMKFSLRGLNMEVARQCSGIHSSIALFILSLVIGHFYLKSGWKKVLLSLAVFPIISVTNGLRIFSVSYLSAYVSMSFMTGNLHRKGGVLFFLLGLILLAVLVRLLRPREQRRSAPAHPVSASGK